MNATPANLNPVNPVQTPSAAGKQQDAAKPDRPFSQVLSSEIAQNRRDSEAKNDPAAKAGSEAKSQPADSTEGPKDATAAKGGTEAKSTEGEDATRELAPSESNPVAPDSLLALALHPDQLKPEPASTEGALTEQSPDLDTNIPNFPDGRKGRSAPGLQAGRLAREAADAPAMDSTASGKADFRAAAANAAPAPAAVAAAFSGQLSAARQSDAMKTAELPSDLVSNLAMRATPHAPLDAPAPLDAAGASKLAPSVGSAAWSQALGEKVVWMAAGAQQTASLTLNPPNMGPLQVVLNISNDQATASFFSTQPEVRQALEQAFPKLREMMNEAGIQLGEATVSADTPQQNDTSDRQAQRIMHPFSGMDEAPLAGPSVARASVQQSGRGLIDTFA
jgi:flagellar hook-length control protein FliK